MTDRDLATVLAALRFWQDEMCPQGNTPGYPEYFYAHDPLTTEQIDELILDLNFENDPRPKGGVS